jgi:hypothetical protein
VCLLSGLLWANAAFATILTVQQHYQEKDNWCWAATSQAILEYYGTVKTQTQIAQYAVPGGANETNYLFGSSETAYHGVDEILMHFAGLGSTGAYRYLTEAALTNQINLSRPVGLYWSWDSGGGHILAAKGIDGDTVYLMDPWYGPTINTYSWVVRSNSDGHTWTESLTMDTGPRLTLLSFSINNGDTSTASRTVTLNNTATGSPTQYMASQSSTFSGAIWKPYSTTPSFTLSAGNGTKTVYFRVKNAMGVSAKVSDTIVLAQPPTVTSFKINGGAASTITQTVKLNNTATVSPTQFMASESPTFTGAVWSTYSTGPSFTLSAGSGIKTVYFKVKNSAGESIIASDTIKLIVRPAVTSFQIDNGHTTTSSRTVTLNNTATNSPVYYMASRYPNFFGAVWKPYLAAPSFTLSAGNGLKTVYFKVKNAAGASTVVSDTITLN